MITWSDGMTTIVPDMDFTKPAQVDPDMVFQAIEDFGITNMFGSPALLNTVSRAGEAKGVQGSESLIHLATKLDRSH